MLVFLSYVPLLTIGLPTTFVPNGISNTMTRFPPPPATDLLVNLNINVKSLLLLTMYGSDFVPLYPFNAMYSFSFELDVIDVYTSVEVVIELLLIFEALVGDIKSPTTIAPLVVSTASLIAFLTDNLYSGTS